MNRHNKISRVVIATLAVIAISTLVSGCSLRKTTTTAPKVFTIWAFDDEDVWKPIIKEAQKEALKGYEVKYVKKTLNDAYENESLNSILSGEGPDVWAIPSDSVYRHKDKLAPMPDDLIKSSKLNLDDQFAPAIKQSAYFENKLYALSPTVDTLRIYYNEKLLQDALTEYSATHKGSENAEARKTASKLLSQVPTTWTGLVETVKLINKQNGNNFERSGIALGATNNIFESADILSALMLQNGAGMTSADVSLATFNLPDATYTDPNNLPAKKALDFYASFANPASPNYSWNSSMPNSVDAFSQGRVAMIIGYGSLANRFSQIYPNIKYKQAPLPQIGASNEYITDYANFITFVNPRLSAQTTVAWQFILSLTTTQGSSYTTTVKISSSAKKKDFQPSLKDREGDSAPGKIQTQTAKIWIKGKYPREADSALRTAIDNVLSGQQDSKSALDTAANSITNLLRKETW